jgi:HlyD family secretion protein
MIPIQLARRFFWPVIVVAIASILIVSAVLFARSAPAPSASRAGTAPGAGASDGVVCFGTVDLEHGVTSLYPLSPGRVAEVLVEENQTVSEGTELLRLEDGMARSHLAEAEAAVELARLQLQRARKLPEQQRARISQQQAVQEAMRNRVAAARQVLAQKQKVTQPAVIAAMEVATSELQVRELEALERVEAQRLAELRAQDVEADIQRAEKELAVAEARRDQARLALEECRLKAPRPGTILRLLVSPGEVLGGPQSQPSVLFAADGPQVIRATVEQEFAPRIKEGKAALIEDQANSAITWRGRVERVAGWYSQRRAVLHDPSQMTDVHTLECVIVLDPDQPRLRLGQAVRVFIGAEPR